MNATRRNLVRQAIVPLLFLDYLLVMSAFPSHWNTLLLGTAVVAAAREWEVWGGLTATLLAGVALLFGLWKTGLTGQTEGMQGLEGYFWAWAATLALAIYVGSFTRQNRNMVRINADLRQAQEHLAALHTIAVALSTTLDVKRVMAVILEHLGKLWGYDYGAIVLLDDATGELVVADARGYVTGSGQRIPPDEGICWDVMRTGTPICLGDVTNDPRYVVGVEGARSELAVPLIWEGKPMGVLNVESTHVNAFGPADMALLTTVAEQAAAALRNARLHQQTQYLAMTDSQTGLYNYRALQAALGAQVKESNASGQPFALVMLDVDHFKRCNDTYGHPTGDFILGQVAALLRETVGRAELCYRYGGEEFAVILPGADHEAALLLAEQVRRKIAGYLFTTETDSPIDFQITASIGIATFPHAARMGVDLLVAADQALYTAKRSGRNRVVCNSPEPMPADLQRQG